MAATAITAAVARAALNNYLGMGKFPVTFQVDPGAVAAKANITLPYLLDTSHGCPILSIGVCDPDTPASWAYNLINTGGTCDQVALTATVADQPASGQFMVGNAAGSLAANVIVLGDAVTANSLLTVTAFIAGPGA